MGSSIQKAIALILSADRELLNILGTTARVSLTSSVIALLIGTPLGIALGLILMTLSLIVNVVLSLMQRRMSR